MKLINSAENGNLYYNLDLSDLAEHPIPIPTGDDLDDGIIDLSVTTEVAGILLQSWISCCQLGGGGNITFRIYVASFLSPTVIINKQFLLYTGVLKNGLDDSAYRMDTMANSILLGPDTILGGGLYITLQSDSVDDDDVYGCVYLYDTSKGLDISTILEEAPISDEDIADVLVGVEVDLIDEPNSTAITAITDAMKAITGLTGAGGEWTWGKITRITTAWIAGNWRQKTGDSSVQELLDAEDGETIILEQTLTSEPGSGEDYRTITVKI